MVAKEDGLVPPESETPRPPPLLEALQWLRQRGAAHLEATLSFLDACLSRLVTAPVKYLEAMQDLAAGVDEERKDLGGATP